MGSAAGIFAFSKISLRDAVGNEREYSAADLTSMGATTSFEVTGTADTTAPTMSSFSCSPATVDITAADAVVTCTLGSSDSDLSGCEIFIENQPGSTWSENSYGFSCSSPTEDYTFDLPMGSAAGIYAFSKISLRDAVGNEREVSAADLTSMGATTSFKVIGTTEPEASDSETRVIGFVTIAMIGLISIWASGH